MGNDSDIGNGGGMVVGMRLLVSRWVFGSECWCFVFSDRVLGFGACCSFEIYHPIARWRERRQFLDIRVFL